MFYGFFFSNITFQVDAHEVAMHGDMFEHTVEAIWDGDFDVGFGKQCVERCAFEKVDFAVKYFEVFGFDVSGQVDACGTFADIGFDEYLSLLAGYRDTMMSVYNEIDLPIGDFNDANPSYVGCQNRTSSPMRAA